MNLEYKGYTEINRKFLFLPVIGWNLLVIIQIYLKYPKKRKLFIIYIVDKSIKLIYKIFKNEKKQIKLSLYLFN